MSSVHTGQHVTSPPVPQTRPQARPATENYTVKSGDSLWNIAKEKYGDGMKWKDIYADNKDVIGGNPDLIHPGMNLQLRGLQSAAPAATTPPAAAPQETAPEPAPEATPDPVEQNQVADVPGGSAATTVDLFDEEETPVATPQAHPELVEEPAAEETPVAPVTEPVAEPAAEPATEVPAAQAAAEQTPDVQAAETPTAPVNEPAVAPAAEGAEAPVEAPIEEPSAMTFPPAVPTPDAAESDAPPVIATSEAPAVNTESPAPLATPAAEAAPEADTAPASPELAQAAALLSTIDGKGYTVAHHGDPVGGIPKVARAMDDVLAMSASGAIDKLPEGATRDKMNQWAQDIVQGRLAQAGRQFDGVTESRTAKVNDLLSHPAFEQLPAEQQDRLYQGLRSGYEMMGYLPADRLSDTGKALQSRLAEHFGDVAPAQTETPVAASEAPAMPAPSVDTPEDTAPASGLSAAEPAAPVVIQTPDLATPSVVESLPEVDMTPANPELDQAVALLSTIDGKGYTVAHHGDPVGGIPKVVRAMDEVLAMSASGAIDKLPEGATRDKMNQWAQDIVQGRLAQAGRQFDGVTESRTAKVNDLLSHPAFEQLPTEQQDRLYQGLRSGYEMMGYLPADRLSDTGKALQSRLAEHFGDTAPASAETAPVAEAPEGIAAEPVVSEAAPVVETTAPVMPAPAPAPVAEPPVAVQAESPEAPVVQPESPAPLATPAAESLPEVDTAPANPELDQAVALLSTIDGKGYTVAHHGDPVGGIPKVVRAMDEVLAMSASGDIDKLPEGATRDKMNQWAQDIVQGRLAQAGRQFDGVTESRTAKVNDLLSHPAFEQLPTEQQDRLYQGLRSGYEMMGYLPADRLSETGKALQSRLAEHFGDTAPAAEAPAPQAPETAVPQATISTDDLRATLQENVGFFGKGDHQKKLLTQSQSLVAATPAARQEVSQLLSDHQQYEVLSGLLAEASSAQMAEVLTHPDIRGLRVIEASEDAVAGQFLTALAEHKTAHVGAEDLIARTVDAFDGTFNDREDPFEILMKQQAFENLSEALQAQIRDLVKGW